jgi:hypothetical protein
MRSSSWSWPRAVAREAVGDSRNRTTKRSSPRARAEALGLGAEAGEAQEGSDDPKGALVAPLARRLA